MLNTLKKLIVEQIQDCKDADLLDLIYKLLFADNSRH